MKKYFIGGLLPFLILFGLSYGLIKAADVEIILGTSSGFNVVRGTSVSAGTSTFFVGSSTVSVGTTTQNLAMLTIVGSSTDTTGGLRVTNSSGTVTMNVRNDGAVLIGTNTSTLSSALYVGSATSGSLGTITAGFLSMGTISANTGLHGTTTVRFLADIYANGTVTAAKFSGDGSSLTGITATSLGSTSSINTTGTINAGSTTVSVLTTTGSATVTGTLTAASNNFVVGSTGSMTASSITVSTGTLTVASGAFKVDETGSMTAARVTASTLAVSGTATIATTSGNVGIGTTTPQHKLVVSGSMYAPRNALSDTGINGTITVNWNNSNVQSVAFDNASGNRNIVFTNGQDGGKYILILKQGSTATSTASWPATSTVRWSGGGTGTALTGTVSKTDYFGFIYNGINSVYDAVAERLNF